MKALTLAAIVVAMVGTAHADTSRTRTLSNGDRVTLDRAGRVIERKHTLANGGTVTRDTAGRITERTRTTGNGDQVTTTYDNDEDEGNDYDDED